MYKSVSWDYSNGGTPKTGSIPVPSNSNSSMFTSVLWSSGNTPTSTHTPTTRSTELEEYYYGTGSGVLPSGGGRGSSRIGGWWRSLESMVKLVYLGCKYCVVGVLSRCIPSLRKQDDEDEDRHFTDYNEEERMMDSRQSQLQMHHRKYTPPEPLLPTPPPSVTISSSSINEDSQYSEHSFFDQLKLSSPLQTTPIVVPSSEPVEQLATERKTTAPPTNVTGSVTSTLSTSTNSIGESMYLSALNDSSMLESSASVYFSPPTNRNVSSSEQKS